MKGEEKVQQQREQRTARERKMVRINFDNFPPRFGQCTTPSHDHDGESGKLSLLMEERKIFLSHAGADKV